VNTYAYCNGDPVNLVDPDGLRAATQAEIEKMRFIYNYILNDADLQNEYGESIRKVANQVIGDLKAVISATGDYEKNVKLQAVWNAVGRLWNKDTRSSYKASSHGSDWFIGKGKDKYNLFAWSCYSKFNRPWRTKYAGYYAAEQTADPTVKKNGWASMQWNGKNAEVGDIVAFKPGEDQTNGHMTVHIGGGLLIAAGGSPGVVIRSYNYVSSHKGGNRGLIRRILYWQQ
jgi:hypothetical protein